MAAVQLHASGVGPMAAQGVEHLAAQLGEHGGVVLAIDEEGFAVGAHAALYVGYGADRGPEVAQLIDRNMVSKTFPDVIGGHALADDVGVVSGKVEEAAGFDGGVMHQGDVTNRRAKACSQDADAGVALLLQPAKAAAGVVDSLAIGLEGQADVRAANLVGALVPLGHAAIMVRHGHLECGNTKSRNPVAEAVLPMPFGVPVGKDEHSATLRRFDGWLPISSSRPQAGIYRVVFRPGGFDRTGERQDVVGIELVVVGRGGGEPVSAVFDGVLGILMDERGWVRVVWVAADVLQAPVEGLDAPVIVGGPAAVLVAADFAFKPVHEEVDS